MTLFHTDTHPGYSGPTVPGNHCPYQWLYIIHYAVLYDPISHRHTHRVFRAHSSWQSLSLPMAVYHTLRCPIWPYFTQTHTQGIQGPHAVPGNHCPYQWLYIIHYAVLYDPISHRHTHRVFRAHSSWQSLSLPMAVYHTLRCPRWPYFTQTHTQGIQGPQFLAITVPTNGCISYITLSYMTLFHTDTHTGYSGPTVPGNHCPYQWLYIIHYAVLDDPISHRHTHRVFRAHSSWQSLSLPMAVYHTLRCPRWPYFTQTHTHRVFRAHSSWQSLSLPMAVYHTLRCPIWPYFTQTHTQGIQGPQFLAITVPTNGCISYITLS